MFNSQAPNPQDLPSSAQLLKSTVISALAAVAILVTIVLPSEYGIDPTGAGKVIGLTAMGEIKSQLAEEAENDKQLDAKTQPAAIRNEGQVQTGTAPQQGSSLLERIINEFVISSAQAEELLRTDEISITLQPGEGTEVKLVMVKGAKANYSWTANGSQVNFDKHGDGGGENISYEKGRGVGQDSGVLEAAFDGQHGWFWRNRSSVPVTVTLKTDGAYSDFKQLI